MNSPTKPAAPAHAPGPWKVGPWRRSMPYEILKGERVCARANNREDAESIVASLNRDYDESADDRLANLERARSAYRLALCPEDRLTTLADIHDVELIELACGFQSRLASLEAINAELASALRLCVARLTGRLVHVPRGQVSPDAVAVARAALEKAGKP